MPDDEKPKKLFEVTVEYTVYVVAENEREAEEVAQQYAHEDEPAFTHGVEIKNEGSIDKDWVGSIPYGGVTDDKTCTQVIRELYPPPPEPPYNDPNQMELPGCEEEDKGQCPHTP